MKRFFLIIAVLSSIFFVACNNGETNDNEEVQISQEIPTEEIYKTMCVACHGMDGKLEFSGAKDLSISTLPLEERIEQITYGKGAMNAFEGILTTDEIERVAIYIEDLRQ